MSNRGNYNVLEEKCALLNFKSDCSIQCLPKVTITRIGLISYDDGVMRMYRSTGMVINYSGQAYLRTI
jgi:hypothetical protein